MGVNIWAVVVTTVVAYVIGAIWYSVLFQKQWMEVTGANKRSPEEMKKMAKEAGPFYVVQLLITLLQVYVLARFINQAADTNGLETAIWIFAGFILPTLVGAVMWTGAERSLMKKQIGIQLGCQIVTVVVMGAILGMWR